MHRNTLYRRYLLLVVFSLVGFLVYLDAISYINQLLRPYYGPRLFCYTLPQVDSNTLEISEYKVQPNSIFFIETSCRHGSRIGLTPRQACAYESAAKAHPYSEILVLIPSQISWNEAPRWVAELTKNRNLRLLRVNVSKYLEKTPLQNFDFLSKLDESYYPEAHAADVIRLVTLWKYGGTYLDSDFIIFKPVNKVQNFVAAQAVLANDSIANGILNFNDRGKPILEALLKELQPNFPGKNWGGNGPILMTKVISKICNESDTRNMTREKCGGLTVYPPPPDSPFLTVFWRDWEQLFNVDAEHVPELMARIGKGLALHGYNHMSADTPASQNSPYNIFASKYCPDVYSTVHGHF